MNEGSSTIHQAQQSARPILPKFHLHHTAIASIEALKKRLHEAQSSIEFETFYFLPDAVGREILDILVDKARKGIKVRLLCDTMGSFSITSSMYIKELHKAGSHVKFFNTIFPFSKTAKSFWYLRNHRRTIIIDGRILFVGSLCIGEPAHNWIETMIELHHSAAIDQAKGVFNKTWKKSSRRTFKIGNASELSTDAFSYITQSPLQNQRHLYNLLMKKIRESKRSIVFAIPYLVPDHRLFRTLRKAAKRGVRITFICPKATDFYSADLARDSFIHSLLKLKMDVYLLPFMIHSKVAIFDADHLAMQAMNPTSAEPKEAYIPRTSGAPSALIGTLNLDNISLRYNYECAIYTDDKECVHELAAHMHSIINRHPETKLSEHAWLHRSVFRKILEFLILPLRKLF